MDIKAGDRFIRFGKYTETAFIVDEVDHSNDMVTAHTLSGPFSCSFSVDELLYGNDLYVYVFTTD